MKDNGMNFISFMMCSTAENDPHHDGYAWPVTNPRLRCYMDTNCTNADGNTEFLSEIIEEAAELGFHVNLFQNAFSWGNRVKIGYPALSKTYRDFHHCVDNPAAWEIACAEVADLFSYYSRSAINSYGFEMVGRWGCKCPDTMRRFNDALSSGQLEKYAESDGEDGLFSNWERWDAKQMLKQYVSAIRHMASSVDIWHHGYRELGDLPGNRFSPGSYRESGVDVAMPCIHSITGEDDLRAVINSAEDFPLVLHVDTRDTPTMNYDIPLKTPATIRNMGKWIVKHHRECLRGVVFFNEPPTSRPNRNAVYEVLRDWQKAGLV
ncbi:MAG: hypothetical protein V1800_12395 [Candidatus Latescibacterota bacterium]